jgi:hypothetical protein
MAWDVEQLSELVVDTSFKIHRDIGPGMLESACELDISINRHCEEPKATRQSRNARNFHPFWIASLRSQ